MLHLRFIAMLKRNGEESCTLWRSRVARRNEMEWWKLRSRNWKGEGQKSEKISRSNVTRQKMSRILH